LVDLSPGGCTRDRRLTKIVMAKSAADVPLNTLAKSGAERYKFVINCSGSKSDDEIPVIITPTEGNKMSNYYAAVSALIFALVTVAHLVRLIKR
jgi:hypothetical protein